MFMGDQHNLQRGMWLRDDWHLHRQVLAFSPWPKTVWETCERQWESQIIWANLHRHVLGFLFASELSSINYTHGGVKNKNSMWHELIVSVAVAMGYVCDKVVESCQQAGQHNLQCLTFRPCWHWSWDKGKWVNYRCDRWFVIRVMLVTGSTSKSNLCTRSPAWRDHLSWETQYFHLKDGDLR